MRCLLVYPRFLAPSFWNYVDTCDIIGARYPTSPLGLVTVAAMLPESWELRLVDRNVQSWDDTMLDWADIVLIGGMLAQQVDALDLIRLAKARGKTVVVGGPDATSSPHVYGDADHLVLNEAEVTLPPFLADLEAGTTQQIYTSDVRPDITESPCPRFDLLDFEKYLFLGVQWCRGCPFNCEFCDIIELFGRVPRTKSTEQMLTELQAIYDLGWRGHVQFVDDNFIGTRKQAKLFLPHLRDWLAERDWPFEFSTEASLNLADDDELLQLMQEVGFFTIFVGIETPDETTLIASKKRQNTHRVISESVEKIHRHGIWVNAGYILGFDTEQGSVAKGMIECVEATGIPVNMVGLLFALPNTQLTKRLRNEGRLYDGFEVAISGEGCHTTAGLNFKTRRPREEILQDFIEVVESIYDPAKYFGRVERVARQLDLSKHKYRTPRNKLWIDLRGLYRLMKALGRPRRTRRHFWRLFFKALFSREMPFGETLRIASMYIHMGPFAEYAANRTRETIRIERQQVGERTEAYTRRPALTG